MIKAMGKDPTTGRNVFFIGLSYGNLDKFRAEPLNTFIRIDGNEVNLPCDVVVFSGRTEAEMGEMIMEHLAPDAQVNISDRSKS